MRSIPEATIAIGRVRSMPFGRSRAEAAARQVRIVEAEGPDEVRAYALESLVEALTWSGESEKALVPFVKLLRWWDLHPEHFDSGDQNILFWEFGWIVNNLSRSPSVPMQQVDRTLDDMEHRFSLANRGMERVWCCRLEWALIKGSEDLENVFTTWLTMSVDEEDSCAACHQEYHAAYLLEIGDIDGAVAILEAAIASQSSCSREPAAMLSLLAWCYVHLGRLEDAERTIPQAMAELKVATSMSVLMAYARLFEVYAQGHHLDKALSLMVKISEGMDTAVPFLRLETLRFLFPAAKCLMAQGHGEEPITFQGEKYTIAEIAAIWENQAVELTEIFDQRHGSDVQARRLAEARLVESTTRPLVFSAPPIKFDSSPIPPEAVGWKKDTDAVERAEEAFIAGDHQLAASLFRSAAEVAQTDGHLAEAGWYWAEAARNAQEAGQLQVAGHDYIEAQTRLKAAGVTLEDILPLFVAWAPVVQQWDYQTFVDMACFEYPTPARTPGSDKIEEIMPLVFEASMISTPLVKRYVLARAELRDTLARVMATWGNDDDKKTAIDMVEESASRFSLLGYTDAAGHSWWLAARLAPQINRSSTRTNYIKALDCFQLAGQRGRNYCVQVAGDYSDYLKSIGDEAEATKVLESWKDE